MAQSSQPITSTPIQHFDPEFERRTYKKVIWRLMPFLFMCYIFAYIDRTNISFATLSSMNKDLGISDAVIGYGAGIFFWGYMLSKFPATWL